MSEQRTEFDKWFDDYEHNNDIRLAINYGAYEIAGDAWQAATAEANKRIDALEVKLNYANDYIRKMDSVIDNKGITRSCINPLVDLTNAVDYAVNKISALEGEVAELKQMYRGAKTLLEFNTQKNPFLKEIAELQASNNDLREAIETALYGHGNDALPKLRKALAATPAESQ